MKTILYLVRHGATAFNLESPPRLQGRSADTPLAPLGIHQAERTRDALALAQFDAVYCSPLQRALHTARIIAAPHRLKPQVIKEITECDVGRWEGISWTEIEREFPREYRQFMDNPAKHGYMGGETFVQVYERTSKALKELMHRHQGGKLLVVAHHVVSRTYLAGIIGLAPEQARNISLDNCSISVVEQKGDRAAVKSFNCSYHLRGVAA